MTIHLISLRYITAHIHLTTQQALASGKCCPHLENLDVSYNDRGPIGGGFALGEALRSEKGLRKLKVLNIGFNNLGSEGGKWIGKVSIHITQCLIFMDWSGRLRSLWIYCCTLF